MRSRHDQELELAALATGYSPEFGILGPLLIKLPHTVAELGPKIRTILASLLLQPSTVVSASTLTEYLWDGEENANARNVLQTYVMRLRNALGPARSLICTEDPGYKIDIPHGHVDYEQFRAFTAQARDARGRGERTSEVQALRRGLELWRGPPLADVPSRYLQDYKVPQLKEEYLSAIERRIDLDLELGNHHDLPGELSALTAEHPLKEHFWGQLMIALYRSDRQADALSVYQQLRKKLQYDLGVDPCEQLQEIYQQVLNADHRLLPLTPALSTAKAFNQIATVSAQIPRQVPHEVPNFVGRAEHVGKILTLISDPISDGVAIVTLSGPPGVGKTALAIHIAHRLKASFPDGQLYFDMRGHSPETSATAAEALEAFLRALGIPPASLPHDHLEQSTLFRSIVAEGHVLVILDNVRDSPQIRPLLPASPRCAVIVTSRNDLIGLTAINDARPVHVDPLSESDATALLSSIIGAERSSREPEALAAIASACGYLPLALRITAARLAHAPERTIESAVEELLANKFAALAIDDDDDARVRHTLDLSYRSLSQGVAELFRMLGLVPELSFDEYAVANLTATSVPTARQRLHGLKNANLVYGTGNGRYRLYDLIRDYARVCSREEDGRTQKEAIQRLFNYYLCVVREAQDILFPEVYPSSLMRAGPPAAFERPRWRDGAAALAWLEAEERNLVTVISCDRIREEATPVWQLAAALHGYFSQRRRDSAWQESYTLGLAAARRNNELTAVAEMRSGIGDIFFRKADFDQARGCYREALKEFVRLDVASGQARTVNGLGCVAMQSADFELAVRLFACSYALLDRTEAYAYRLGVLINFSITLQVMGYSRQAQQHISYIRGKGEALGLWGIVGRATGMIGQERAWSGELKSAEASFENALAIWREDGNPQGIIETERNLAEVYLEVGEREHALNLARSVLRDATELNYSWVAVGSTVLIGQILLEQGEIQGAVRNLTEARESAEAGHVYWRTPALVGLAACYRHTKRYREAVVVLADALSDPRPRERGRAHAERARVALAANELDIAIYHAGTASQIATSHGYENDRARADGLARSVRRKRERGDAGPVG